MNYIVYGATFPTERTTCLKGFYLDKDIEPELLNKALNAAEKLYEDILSENRHRVLILLGPDAGLGEDTQKDLLSYINERKIRYAPFTITLESFDTETEKNAFLKGIRYDCCAWDNQLVLKDETEIDKSLEQLQTLNIEINKPSCHRTTF